MYHGPIGITTGIVTTGVTSAVLLPHSDRFHFMAFVVGLCLLVGLIALFATTIFSLNKRSNKK